MVQGRSMRRLAQRAGFVLLAQVQELGAVAWDHGSELLDVVASAQSCYGGLVRCSGQGEQFGEFFKVMLVAGRAD